jgi:nucleoside-diphosphate-sugar epimerase
MSKKIVIFGGSGKVGGFIMRHLLEHGYEIQNVDQKRPIEDIDVPTILADVRDKGQVYSVLPGADAVIQLAAYPTAGHWPESVIFHDNTLITYNVLEAASNYEIPRVVCMSTLAIIYYPNPTWYLFEPQYMPVDEVHPITHKNAYSLSKHVGELIADMFSRQGHTIPVSLRPPWIVTPNEIRAKGLLDDEKLEKGLRGLWSYIDVRDVARACQAAIEADLSQHEVFNLSAPDTFAPIPTCDLIKRLWPNLTDLRKDLSDFQPLIDLNKTARLLNFEPLYSVREE